MMSANKETWSTKENNDFLDLILKLNARCCLQECPVMSRTGKAKFSGLLQKNDSQGTAFFVKHPFRIEDLKVPHRVEMRKRFTVVGTALLSKIDYENFIADLCVDRPFIEENKELCRVDKDGVWHCLLVQRRGRSDGVLVMPDGRNYPKYAAYYPGKGEGDGRKLSFKKTVLRLR